MNETMNPSPMKTVTLSRGNDRLIIIIRQLPHDPPAIVGRKFRYGAGPKWLVVEVQ